MGPNGRLDSWKAIAAYLKRDESTVRRWEKQGLPVHRHLHSKKASIYAYPSEIDAWWNAGRTRLEQAEAGRRSRRRLVWLAGSVSLIAAAAAISLLMSERYRTGEQIASIAVLPLENLSGDPQQDYFADGITEAIITELGRVKALRVMSRSSVMQYKGRKKALQQVARELRVDAIVEGSVLREGSRVRITAQLMRPEPERQVWAERYEREISSVLSLERDVARAIAAEIHAKLSPQERAVLASSRSVDAQAYEAYLKGRYHWYKATPEGLLKARESFEEAIERDASFAPAYAGLADTYAWVYRRPSRSLRPPREVFPKAKAAVLKALELDDTLAEAHLALAYIKEAYDWDWEGAERSYQRAIELNPSYAAARHGYALFLAISRRFDESFKHIELAERLDPLSRSVKNGKGWLYLWSQQYDLALRQGQIMIDLEPGFTQVHYFRGIVYTQKGMFNEAIASHERAIAMSGETARSLALLAHAYGRAGHSEKAHALIARLVEKTRQDYVQPHDMTIAYLGVGDKEQALKWLERGFEERDELAALARAPFWYVPLQTEPRFQDLLRRLRLSS